MGCPDRKKSGLTSRSWLIIYVVAALIFAIIMFWIATSRGKKVKVNIHNGSHKLDIVEGFEEEKPIAVHI